MGVHNPFLKDGLIKFPDNGSGGCAAGDGGLGPGQARSELDAFGLAGVMRGTVRGRRPEHGMPHTRPEDALLLTAE